MAVKDIQNYIAANQGKYPREVLIAELRKNGYPEGEIQATLQKQKEPYGGAAAPQSVWVKVGWWVFGFVVGGAIFFFGGWLIILVVSELFSYYFFRSGLLLAALVGVSLDLVVYFWFRKRLKYFVRGVLTALIVMIAIVGFLILVLISLFGGGIDLIPFL